MTDRRAVAWTLWRASRPAQLLLILGVYLLGAKAAAALGAAYRPTPIVAGAVPLLAVAVSVHYANEYADHETDRLTERTPFSGGSGALGATGLPRSLLLRGGTVALLAGTLAAVAATLAGRLPRPALLVLLVIAVFGWQYSVGPLRLAWRGLGELDNAALGGLALPAYGAAVVGGPIATVVIACVPFFLVVLLNLFATQWPDRTADAAVGKRTLAVRWPRRRLRVAYVLVAVAAGVALVVVHPSPLPTPVAGASLVAAPFVVLGAAGYTERRVPWATVTAMVLLAVAQLLAWCLVA